MRQWKDSDSHQQNSRHQYIATDVSKYVEVNLGRSGLSRCLPSWHPKGTMAPVAPLLTQFLANTHRKAVQASPSAQEPASAGETWMKCLASASTWHSTGHCSHMENELVSERSRSLKLLNKFKYIHLTPALNLTLVLKLKKSEWKRNTYEWLPQNLFHEGPLFCREMKMQLTISS